jgi:hypothetical protein
VRYVPFGALRAVMTKIKNPLIIYLLFLYLFESIRIDKTQKSEPFAPLRYSLLKTLVKKNGVSKPVRFAQSAQKNDVFLKQSAALHRRCKRTKKLCFFEEPKGFERIASKYKEIFYKKNETQFFKGQSSNAEHKSKVIG